MPISKNTIPLSFSGGLQSKTDALQVRSPALLELQNAMFDKLGALNKRPGYDILSNQVLGDGLISSAVAIDSFNDELNLFNNQSIFTYLEANGTWANRGPAISLINTNQQVVRSAANQQLGPDSGSVDGINVFAWEDSRGTCRYSVVDTATQAYAIADAVLTDSLARPKVVVFNDRFYIFFTFNNNLSYCTINPNNPGVATPTVTVAADGSADFTYDVTVSNNRLYVTYFSLTGNKFFYLDTSNVITAIAPVSNGTTGVACSIVGDSLNQIWISWSDGTEVLTACYNGTPTIPTVILAGLIIDTVVCPAITGIESVNIGSLQLVYEVTGAIPSKESTKSLIIKTDGSMVSVGTLLSVGLASKPFRYGADIFVNLAFESTLQSTYFMVFLTNSPFTIVSKVAAEVGGGLIANGMVPEANQATSGIILWANLIKGRFLSEDNTSFSLLGVNATISDFTNINKFNSVTFSDNLLFVGGILQNYDGISVNEQNFHLFPEDFDITVVGSGGALSAGQYQYQVVYSWTDKFGQIQYSSPSPSITVTTVLNDSVRLVCPTIRLTAKTGVVIKIYRTQVNGVVFQEVTSELAPLLNSTTVNTVTFTDVAADTAIAGNQTIYTTGGVLPNASPPSCGMISLFNDRVFIGGLEDPNLLWFSKNKINNSNFNTIPAEFSQFLTVGVNQLGGPITGLGLMDQNLIIFKKNAIFLLNGDGPNDTGGGNSFGDPQLITQSVGCVNQNSIILTTQGIMFQTPNKGIWMLPRSLGEPVYVGAGVDTEAKQYVVSSAVLDPNSNSIIFTTFTGPALVYDYLIGQWSTWTNHQAIDAVNFNSAFTFCKSNGRIYNQDAANFYDGYVQGNQVPYAMEVVTPWLSYSQILGYQRIFRFFILGTYKGSHNLNVDIGYDFNPSFTASTIIDATSLPGSNVWGSDPFWGSSTPWGGAWEPYIFQVNMPIQKCTSFRIKLYDSQTMNANNEGFILSSLLLELGQLPGGVRVPKTNKFGAV